MTYSVYVFLDQKNRPYYVGKTNNMHRRRKEHLAEISNGNTLPKYKAARKLRSQGVPFKMRAIAKTFNEESAYKLERHYIRKFKREGYFLLNCTYGGPEEIPMKIVPPKRVNPLGIKIPSTSKKPKRKKPKLKTKPIRPKRRKSKKRF